MKVKNKKNNKKFWIINVINLTAIISILSDIMFKTLVTNLMLVTAENSVKIMLAIKAVISFLIWQLSNFQQNGIFTVFYYRG